MELSEEDKHRIAGLILQRYLHNLDGKKLHKQKLCDRLKTCLRNLPHEMTEELLMSTDTFADDLMARCFGYGDSGLPNDRFAKYAYIALLGLRYADEDGLSLTIHTKRRTYAESLQGYSKEQVYQFVRMFANDLLDLMAPPKN
jgi:hypothetical protein